MVLQRKLAQIPPNDVLQYVQWMIRNSHPPVFPLNPFPPSYAPPVLGAPSGTERSYRHKQPVGKPMGCCHMPCARCTPRSGAGGRTSHTAPTGSCAPLNDVYQRGHIGANVPRLARRSPKPLGWVRFPTVPASGRVAPGQCETVRRGSHGNDNAR